jgi:hypothetical protein
LIGERSKHVEFPVLRIIANENKHLSKRDKTENLSYYMPRTVEPPLFTMCQSYFQHNLLQLSSIIIYAYNKKFVLIYYFHS